MMYTTEKLKDFVPSCFKGEGTAHINGQDIPYHTVAEDNVIYDKDGNALASIYSYSYFRSDVETTVNRPVLFCYNGGPGTSSMYVHAGFMGPRRLSYGEVDRPTSLPPYEVIDNPDCLLDIADIVLIDPVNTGYGILIDETKGDQFFGIEQDGEAILTFIDKWLTKYNRFLSPKYLVGESYGCTRNAVVAGFGVEGTKNRDFDIAFDGVVMIGNSVTPGQFFGKGLPVEKAVICFESWAAINWYHNHPSDQTLEEFVYEAKAFGESDYLLALYQGEDIDPEFRKEVKEKVMYYTGVSSQYLEDNNLNINEFTYRSEVLRDKGLSVSRLDGRITRPAFTPWVVEQKTYDDALDDRYDAAFLSCVCNDLLPRMNVKLDRTYMSYFNAFSDENKGYKWDNSEPSGTTGEHLNNAMRRNFGMRVFFANGWYDTATYTGYIDYLLTHQGLPKDRICRRDYPSGHMIYLGEENCRMLSSDIRTFVLGGMPSNEN